MGRIDSTDPDEDVDVEETWRWWGPDDSIALADVSQTGATGIVTALHDFAAGAVWPRDAIEKRRRIIEEDSALGLRWSVVESVPVAEPIKIGEGVLEPLFNAYRQTLRNLADCGIRTVCYNFMPVLDWTRTDLQAPLRRGGRALRFSVHEFAAFDAFILKRDTAQGDYSQTVLQRAREWFEASSPEDRDRLLGNIMAGLPGAFDRYDVLKLRAMLDRYRDVTPERLKANLERFLSEIIPTAEDVGIRMCIHPDDPPFSLLGLPRIVSTEADLRDILAMHPSIANGLTLCTGSLGARPGNDLPGIAARYASRIHFAHLRNVTKFSDGSFMEADHLGGDTDIVSVVQALLIEQKRRKESGDRMWRIPFRPDHGHELLDDVGKPTHPGYPAIGRLRGLAELRGVIKAVAHLQGLPV
jgi:mannonate dehydratase